MDFEINPKLLQTCMISYKKLVRDLPTFTAYNFKAAVRHGLNSTMYLAETYLKPFLEEGFLQFCLVPKGLITILVDHTNKNPP